MHAMGLCRLNAKAGDTIFLIGLEVAFVPIPVARILIGAFPSKDVRRHAVEEEAVVTRDDRATRELVERAA